MRVQWWTNPRLLLREAWFAVIGAWRATQGGMGGRGWLPEPGGLNQQPAWLVSAFRVLDAEDARIQALRSKERE